MRRLSVYIDRELSDGERSVLDALSSVGAYFFRTLSDAAGSTDDEQLLTDLWSLVWSIVGLWTAARNGHKIWFGVFLFIHTLGILEIIYLSTNRRQK